MKLSTRFIKATEEICDFDRPVPAPYIRKTFTLETEPQQAEITICGLGFYELYINGKNIKPNTCIKMPKSDAKSWS